MFGRVLNKLLNQNKTTETTQCTFSGYVLHMVKGMVFECSGIFIVQPANYDLGATSLSL